MGVTLEIAGLEGALRKTVKAMTAGKGVMWAGVKTSGPAAKYALVWEWGTLRWSHPGPKTMWSTNPAGDTRIMTITAPHGFIRVNHDKFVAFVKEEFAKVPWGSVTEQNMGSVVKSMLRNAMTRCEELIAATAPIDTGQLRASIERIEPGDPLLEQGTSNEYGPTELSLGTEWQ